jgi:hypothetical protein
VSDAEVVVPLRLRGLAHVFPLFSVAMVVCGAALVALLHSWDAYIYGGLLILSFGWICVRSIAARRFPFASPVPLVATAGGLRSLWWEVGWESVERMSIGRWEGAGARVWDGRSARRSPKALVIERRDGPEVVIHQTNVDRPLEHIAAEFERLAGRPLVG